MFETIRSLSRGARDQMSSNGMAHAYQSSEVQFFYEQANILGHDPPVRIASIAAGTVEAQVHRIDLATWQVLDHLSPAPTMKASGM